MRVVQLGIAVAVALALVAGLALAIGRVGPPGAVPVPAPRLDELPAAAPGSERVVLAGGCFWGVQAVYEHVRGVLSATAGYAGGAASTADYEDVSTGSTGHAESVRVVYDPRRITLGRLLQIFFSVAADPTEWNRQGPDVGSQYRSVIFYASPEQQQIAAAYIRQLTVARVFRRSIVTEVAPLPAFYPAEAYHQDYAARHPGAAPGWGHRGPGPARAQAGRAAQPRWGPRPPDDPYIQINDLPKLVNLRRAWPRFYRAAARETADSHRQ